jgi:hypothetical protein
LILWVFLLRERLGRYGAVSPSKNKASSGRALSTGSDERPHGYDLLRYWPRADALGRAARNEGRAVSYLNDRVPVAALMMHATADTFDIVPICRLVAKEALFDLSRRLPGHLGQDHLEVLHGMAHRRLVALIAFGIPRRRVPELGDGPRHRPVALGAIAPEILEMAVLGSVAGCTVKGRFTRSQVRIPAGSGSARAVRLFDPAHQLLAPSLGLAGAALL